MRFTCKVVEAVNLPTARLRDPAGRPVEHEVVTTEFDHRLRHPRELMGVAQIAAHQLDDRFQILVQDRESLAGVANSERIRLGRDRNRFPVLGKAAFAERCGVSNRIGLDKVLIDERKACQPCGECDQIGRSSIANVDVQL